MFRHGNIFGEDPSWIRPASPMGWPVGSDTPVQGAIQMTIERIPSGSMNRSDRLRIALLVIAAVSLLLLVFVGAIDPHFMAFHLPG